MKHEIVHITPAQLEELRKRLKRRESSVTAAAAARDAGELQAVEASLARMDAGTYGLCAECEAAMPWLRLSAMPEAPRCVRCEAARESRSRAHATL